tara:strand:+ start:1094 stop:1405 length:312 start_codon:yes stop_codon:yes gene_type:complete
MSQSLTPEQIERILTNYKAKKEREYNYYHAVKKTDEKYIAKNRERAKAHYNNNKDAKKEKYEADKDYRRAQSLYNYYKKLGQIDKFEEKHPEKMNIVKVRGTY